MLKAETWLNGAEAVEKGFADTLEPERHSFDQRKVCYV
jgi:ATP-dependent protease ClpP protease subunit